jgi:uncharacterized membrane protein YccC
VFCALFASFDDPAPVIIYFAVCSLLTLALGAVYNFGVFQAISGFPLLALALFPPLFLLAVPMADARLTAKVTPLIISFTNALNVQQAAPLDFAAYLNANLGVYAGVLVATFTIRALRSMTVQEGAQRLLRQTWRSVRRLAERGTRDDPAQMASLLVDRLALLAPRLSLHEPEGDAAAQGVVRDLGVAMDLIALRNVQAALASGDAERLDQVMNSAQDIYASWMGQTATSSAEDRLRQIDHALGGLASSPDRQRRCAALALVDLRRGLFPQAAEFTAQAEAAA